jgi:hypothetical protein
MNIIRNFTNIRILYAFDIYDNKKVRTIFPTIVWKNFNHIKINDQFLALNRKYIENLNNYRK